MNSLRVLVLGATGGNGKAFIEQALERGHRITAFVRSPEKLDAIRDRVTVRAGDPRDLNQLSSALPSHDAVVSSLGPRGLGRTMIIRDAARTTVMAMQATGVRRLLIVSAAILFDGAGLLPAIFRRTLLRGVAEDCTEMEHIVTASGLDWSILRPPRLTNGRLTGRYRLENGRLPPGDLAVSRADVAHFLAGELEGRAHLRQIVGMAGGRAS